jgi:predicted RNA binding protein YcfA (HicA-like mRNA interferase family)
MKVRDIIREIERAGWFYVRTRGSHHHYHHPKRRGTVTVPGHPNDDLSLKTLISIRRQAEDK